MPELLQEYVSSARERLRVDREAGIIRGVKLLGLASRNGRRYLESALREAIALYEGAKVNVNHPKGHPLGPRDYQDRLGVVRGVSFRAGAGLFGDLHFNPKHALSEQLVWDAEHAPQNVGLSHNVLARTARHGDETIVEAISKVQSVDLVADPATTSGLYEHGGASEPAGHTHRALDLLTLEELRLHRPDLLQEIEAHAGAELKRLETRLDEMIAREKATERAQRIAELLEAHGLPQTPDGPVSPQFLETLRAAPDEAALRQLVEERAAVVRSAVHWASGARRPRAREQTGAERARGAIRSGAEFAAAVRRR